MGKNFDDCGLTEQKLLIFRLLSEGVPTRKIALRMYLHITTVEHHVKSVFEKLDVSNRQEAIRLLIQRGAIPCPYYQGEGE